MKLPRSNDGSGEKLDYIEFIVYRCNLHCKRLFQRFELAISKLHESNFTVALKLLNYFARIDLNCQYKEQRSYFIKLHIRFERVY